MDVIDGRYFFAGEKDLYFKITGEGGPAVIIEPGWGILSAEWTLIQNELSNHTTVISYDRAGYAESASAKNNRASGHIVSELLQALKNSEVPAPFILIGSSAGGFYIQHFARLFPSLVGAVVLVDSITNKFNDFDKLDAPAYIEKISTKTRMSNLKNYADLDKEQFEQFVVPFLKDLYPEFPEPVRHQLMAYQSDQTMYKTILKEFEAFDESCEQIKNSPPFPQIPLKVICRDRKVMTRLSVELGIPENEANMVEDLWQKNCEELTELSESSQLIIAENANHSIHLSNPKVIIEEVLDLVGGFGSYIELGG